MLVWFNFLIGSRWRFVSLGISHKKEYFSKDIFFYFLTYSSEWSYVLTVRQLIPFFNTVPVENTLTSLLGLVLVLVLIQNANYRINVTPLILSVYRLYFLLHQHSHVLIKAKPQSTAAYRQFLLPFNPSLARIDFSTFFLLLLESHASSCW